jgi:8-oxo-dGTP pyrophosphatase MutT (NUDIX family)
MKLGEFEAAIRAAVTAELPGGRAHLEMAPFPRPDWTPDLVPGQARPAAALVLAYGRGDSVHVVLTRRKADLARHAGQIALPGGALEPDESLAEAALREASEEIGLDTRRVRMIGQLSPLHIPVSGFVVHPLIAVGEGEHRFRADGLEVDEVLEVPVAWLLDPRSRRVETRRYGDRDYRVPFFEVPGGKIWGATAMILAELVRLLQEDHPPGGMLPEGGK